MDRPHPLVLDPAVPDIEEVDGWGLDSFPASDPPQNW